jgi:hypothetical protein
MKAFAVIVGMILTIVLYFGIGICLMYFFSGKDTGENGLSGALLFVGFIYIPAVSFLGSISTGLIIEPEMEEQSYLALIFYSPAFYFNIFAGMLYVASLFVNSVFTFFAGNHSPAPTGTFWDRFWFYLIIPAVLLFWHAASWAGTALGYKVRAKISGDN